MGVSMAMGLAPVIHRWGIFPSISYHQLLGVFLPQIGYTMINSFYEPIINPLLTHYEPIMNPLLTHY